MASEWLQARFSLPNTHTNGKMKKILADESVDFRIVRSLREDNYQVEAIIQLNSGIGDREVLTLASEIDAIRLTEDKGFGELTYRLRKPNKGIPLFRMSGESIDTKIRLLKMARFRIPLPVLQLHSLLQNALQHGIIASRYKFRAGFVVMHLIRQM